MNRGTFTTLAAGEQSRARFVQAPIGWSDPHTAATVSGAAKAFRVWAELWPANTYRDDVLVATLATNAPSTTVLQFGVGSAGAEQWLSEAVGLATGTPGRVYPFLAPAGQRLAVRVAHSAAGTPTPVTVEGIVGPTPRQRACARRAYADPAVLGTDMVAGAWSNGPVWGPWVTAHTRLPEPALMVTYGRPNIATSAYAYGVGSPGAEREVINTETHHTRPAFTLTDFVGLHLIGDSIGQPVLPAERIAVRYASSAGGTQGVPVHLFVAVAP